MANGYGVLLIDSLEEADEHMHEKICGGEIALAIEIAEDMVMCILSALRIDLYYVPHLNQYDPEERRDLAAYAGSFSLVAIERIGDVIQVFEEIFSEKNDPPVISERLLTFLRMQELSFARSECTPEQWVTCLKVLFPKEQEDAPQ